MKLDIELLKETGVQGKSIGHLFTPLPTAKALYFYITQIGHYYCTHTYTIRRDYFSPILVMTPCFSSLNRADAVLAADKPL